MSGESPFAGFMDDYFAECDEHLETIRRLLLEIEVSASGDRMVPPPAIEELFRSFHSIKGISGMVELRAAEMLAHQMESYLRVLRDRQSRLTPAGLDALVAGVDALERTIAARRDGQAAPARGAGRAVAGSGHPGRGPLPSPRTRRRWSPWSSRC